MTQGTAIAAATLTARSVAVHVGHPGASSGHIRAGQDPRQQEPVYLRTFFEQRSVGEWLALTASVLVIVGIAAAVLGG